MTIHTNSQHLWERCQHLADCLLREPNMLVPNLTEEEYEDVRDRRAREGSDRPSRRPPAELHDA